MTAPAGALEELVVCSLEPWDEVWRRNQFLVDLLLRRNAALKVLFIEPPADPLHDLVSRRLPKVPNRRVIGYDGRLRAVRPLKILPRRAGASVDAFLGLQVKRAAHRFGLRRPVLWLNDVTYAPLIEATGWPTVYDVTDDWLAAPFAPRELDRLASLERVALDSADAVVVCSPGLAETRGSTRDVTLVPNAVDVDHFRRPQVRPADLPSGAVAVYVGSLHEARLDVDLVVELAHALPALQVTLVGPDSLSEESHVRLAREPNVHLLGARPYAVVPGYLQHADVIVVPHLVNRFTDSLDPIKAYECLAVSTPTVATPVAGFAGPGLDEGVVPREAFSEAVEAALERGAGSAAEVPSWEGRAEEFERILVEAGDRGPVAARGRG